MRAEEPTCCQCKSGFVIRNPIVIYLWYSFFMLSSVFQKAKAFPCTKPDQILWTKNNSSRYKCLDCPECPQGYHPSIPCGTTATYGTPLHCVPCPDGTFSDTYDGSPCHPCTKCNENQAIINNCTAERNTKCGACKKGYYEDNFTGNCHPCSPCCRYKKNEIIEDCRSQKMPYHMICQYHGKLCPQRQTSSIGPSQSSVNPITTPGPLTKRQIQTSSIGTFKSSVIPRTTHRTITKQLKLTTHLIILKEIKTSLMPTTFKQTPFEGNTNSLSIITIVLLATVCSLLVVFIFVVIKYKRSRNNGYRNDNDPSLVEMVATDTSDVSRDTAAASDLALLKDLQQRHCDCFDRLCMKLEQKSWGTYEFERIGVMCNLDKDRVASLRNAFNGDGQSPAKLFIDLLTSINPHLTVRDFCEKLVKIKRHDISDLLKTFIYQTEECDNS